MTDPPHRRRPRPRDAGRARRVAGQGRRGRRLTLPPAAAGHGPDPHLDRGGGPGRARAHPRQVARIGNNLNQIARWANTQATPIDAIEIIVHLIAIEREITRLARL